MRKAVQRAGFLTPSPIQMQAIPVVLSGADLVAQAQTGTGKTAAFGLPALSLIDPASGGLLVVTPTRELAQQVGDELLRFGSSRGFKVVIIQGGSSYRKQIDQIKQGSQIVVATPGRLLDLLGTKALTNFKPSIVVLDEADEMLNMGFLEDVKQIFTYLPEKRQTLLFSATMPPQIQQLAKRILKNPTFLSVTGKETANQDIQQLYYVIREEERDAALIRLIRAKHPVKSIIFCRTKKEVDRLSHSLAEEGFLAKGLHGDLEQNQRNRVTDSFRKGEIDFLVATDVAARGLNIIDVSHVFNFHMPPESENYLHRIGRTGRAGRKGMALTLVTAQELWMMQRLKKMHGNEIAHAQIPTKGEVQQQQLTKLVNEIKKQPLAQEAAAVLARLKEDLDLETIGLNLLSVLLSQHKVDGPDQIGMSAHELQAPRDGRDSPPRKRGRFAGKQGFKPPFKRSREFKR